MQHTIENPDKIKQKNVIPFIPEGNFYFSKGVEAFQKRKYEIAIKWLRKAIEAAPEDPLYKCQMSIVYTETGSYHAANQLLVQVLEAKGDEYADCYYLLANNYAHLGSLSDAKKYAQAYLELKPESDFSDEAKGLLEVIDTEENEEDDDWELEDELLIYQETVFHHMENSEWEQALPLLEEMMILFPDHKLTKHDYAHTMFYAGDTAAAIQLELDILEEEPNALYSHINLAVFYHELEAKQEYETHIQALLNVYPIHEQQKLRVAVTLSKTGNHEEAYFRFRTLAKGLVKSHLSYYKWYSITAYHLGASEKAQSLWEEGCKIHPKLAKETGVWQ